MNRRELLVAMLASAAGGSGAAQAQEFPGRIITLVHGFGPGGPADGIARMVVGPMGTALNRTVVVEPRPGAGGNIAAAALSRAAPDGSLIGLVTGGHAVTAAFGRNQNYEPVDGFEPISQVVRYAFVVAVRADNALKDLKELLSSARASKGALQFGSAGNGTTQHLAGEMLNAMGGAEMTHVPYRGDAASITAVLGGEIPFAITAANVALSLAEAGKLRLLAVTGSQRSARLPAVPTVAEAALPGYDASTWAGILAPRGTPQSVIAQLNSATNSALRDQAVQTKLAELVDGEVIGGSPEALRTLIVTEIDRWRTLIRERRITSE